MNIAFTTFSPDSVCPTFLPSTKRLAIAKFQIALKECYETEYWIELFVKSELLNREVAKELYNQCGTIRRMLISSINTAKENANDKK